MVGEGGKSGHMGLPMITGTHTLTLHEGRDFLTYREGSGGTVEIYDIAVTTERGKGYGRRLVEMMLEKLKESAGGGVHTVYAITRCDNLIAREFYAKLGFKIIAYLPGFYREGDAVMYGRGL